MLRLALVFLLLGSTKAFAPARILQNRNGPAHRLTNKISLSLAPPTAEEKEIKSQDLQLLEDALIQFRSEAAHKILEKLRALRSTNMEASIEFLNQLITQGPDQALPAWAKVLPLSRFSKRARMASLKKALDLSTTAPAKGVDPMGHRRAAFVALLQNLARQENIVPSKTNRPAIRALEKTAVLGVEVDRRRHWQ